ncbi:MAG: serine hydrolase domain-containing protein [Halanaerobium sp.]|nr:serine hydrolase domain-containing protein [Halanaerobium sp.]
MKKLSVFILLILTITLVIPAGTIAEEPPATIPEETQQQEIALALPGLEAFIDGVIRSQLDFYHIPGAVVSIVKGGEILLARGYGYADLERKEKVSPERTLFRPGSISKLSTWTAVMQLVEEGKIDLDADINTYLDFQIPATYDEPITMRNLMTHTPGFEDQGIGVFARSLQDILPLGEYLAYNIPARVYPPGKIIAYSNYGASLAGYIVERLSGMAFTDYTRDNIFKPLDMNSTTFSQPVPQDLQPDLATGYSYQNGKYLAREFELLQSYPAGSLSTTAVDMAHFMIAHLEEGWYQENQVLQKDTMAEMHTRQFSQNQELPGWTLGFGEMELNNKRLITHGGDTFYFHSGMFLLPAEDLGIFVSYNCDTAAPARNNFIEAFMDRYYPVNPPEEIEPPANFQERAAAFAGEYKMARSNYTTPEKLLSFFNRVVISPEDGVLKMQFMDASRWVEVAPLKFRKVDSAELLFFGKDEAGKIKYAYQENMAGSDLIKVPWYGSKTLHLLITALSLLFFFFVLIREIINLVKGKEHSTMALLASLLYLLFAVGFLISAGQLMQEPYSIPLSMRLLTLVPLLAGLLALGVIPKLLQNKAWQRHVSTGRKVYYSIFIIIVILFTLSLSYWNLIGWDFWNIV